MLAGVQLSSIKPVPSRASLTVDGTYYTGKQLDPLKKPYELQVSEILLGASSSLGGNWFQVGFSN